MVEMERTEWSDLRQESSNDIEDPDIPDSDSKCGATEDCCGYVGWRKEQTKAYWMNFKLDANSLPKLSKEKWFSLDMHAETISVI